MPFTRSKITCIPALQSRRIREIQKRKFTAVKNAIMYELGLARYESDKQCRNYMTDADLRRSRNVVLGVTCRTISLVCDNFDLMLACQPQPNIERLFRVIVDRIENDFRPKIIMFRLNKSKLEPLCRRFIRIYTEYKKNKIQNIVLLSSKFPPEIVRVISQYYLSSTNFVQ